MEIDLDTALVHLDEESGIARLTLNRPDSLNALSHQLRADLATGVEFLETHDDKVDGAPVRVIVLEGAGDRAFSAGADVNEFSDAVESFFYICPAREAIESCLIPVISKINGYCLGGGLELALASDVLLASEQSEFGFPEVNHGILPAGGGIQYLTRMIGPTRTMELLLTGEHFGPERAESLGLVNEVHPADQLESQVADLANEIARKPPLATRAIKDAVSRIDTTAVQEGRKYDRGLSFFLKNTADHATAIEAFGSDRTPSFEGR